MWRTSAVDVILIPVPLVYCFICGIGFMYHLSEAYLMAGYICLLAAFLGALTSGASLAGTSSIGLHRFAVISSLSLAMVCAVGSIFSAVPLMYAALMVGIAALMCACFYVALMLRRDMLLLQRAGTAASFVRSRASLKLAFGMGLACGIVLLVGLVYVLPGQFTFWPTQSPMV